MTRAGVGVGWVGGEGEKVECDGGGEDGCEWGIYMHGCISGHDLSKYAH